jgi:hypothetical protein
MHKIKRFLAEREVLIGLVIFGVLVMFADICSDLDWHFTAAKLRIVGILALFTLLGFDLWFRFRRRPIDVPLMFTTEKDRSAARAEWGRFLVASRLSPSVKLIEQVSSVREEDLIIRLDYDPKSSSNPDDWREAWQELLREWEREVDQKLKRDLPADERFCYHIVPHVWLPLSFALGASVGLRRPIVLYHWQEVGIFQVMDLREPRRLFHEPDTAIEPPKRVPDDWTNLPEGGKLILHLGITKRHPFPEFTAHPDHQTAVSVGLVYPFDLKPQKDWLGYVQWLYRETRELLGKYQQVDLCIASPSAIAFALGMAFSRTPKVTVCHYYQDSKYVPVFSLSEIEKRLPFD